MRQVEIKNKRAYRQLRFAMIPIILGGVFLLISGGVRAAMEFTSDPNYNREISELNQEINNKRKAIDELNRQAEAYEKSIASKRREIASLSYQVSTINQTMTKISLEKEALELKIEEVNLQIENNLLKIQATEEEISSQKERLAILVRTLFQSDKDNNLLSILTTNDTISDYFIQLQSLESLQDDLLGGLGKLDNLKIALIQEESSLAGNKTEIEQIQDELTLKSEVLEGQKDAKFSLIEETRGQESKYQELLQNLKDEQTQINNDIVALEQVAREKLNREIREGRIVSTSGPMVWPVPSHFVTTYFHDPDYPFRNVFEHPALDIRAGQGTPVQAAQSGFVARAKDAGMGYSYIMLVHEDGLSTVYGHVSAINVSEGNFVTQGQVIGLSGATPGTPGAGRLTTGPHLHFEVRLNGIPVNPLNYLSQ